MSLIMRIKNKFFDFVSKVVLGSILFYQKTISPDHGFFSYPGQARVCRYWPSCSEYALAVILKYGLFKGLIKVGWRVLRCNPFSKGGIDLP